jgi:RNA polymerase sigma-70 factor (ECF subfamily)
VSSRPAAGVAGETDRQELEQVLAARTGDRRAFARLYRAWVPAVHGVLVSMVRRDEVRDLVQDVFLSALRSIGRLDEPARFGPWLLTIARNRARDVHRSRRAAEETASERVEEHPDPAARPGPEADACREEADRALAALRALPDAYRETLALRLVEGLSGPEIARRTGLTPGSVRVNLCRGMKLLRERLQEREAG